MLVKRHPNPKKRVKIALLESTTTCMSCGGTGKKYAPRERPCIVCKGRGKVPFITGK